MWAAIHKTAVLIYFMVQSTGALAFTTACWDEQLMQEERNGSCIRKFLSCFCPPLTLAETVIPNAIYLCYLKQFQ